VINSFIIYLSKLIIGEFIYNLLFETKKDDF